MTDTVTRQPASVSTAQRRRANGPIAALLLAVLVCAILAGAYVAYYQTNRPAVYRSTATLLIDQPPALFATGNEGVIGKLAELRIKYTSLVPSHEFAVPVAQQAGLPLGKVQGSMSAVADLNTLLITLSAQSSSPTNARTIAQTAATYLSHYIANEQSALGVKTKDQVTLTVVTPAGAGIKQGPSNRKAVLEGAAAFAGVAVVGVFIADLARRRRWT